MLADLFDQVGVEADAGTLESGQSLLFTALAYVEWARTTDERIEYFGGLYPWTQEHIIDPSVPGSPPGQAIGVAARWQATWDRLHGRPFDPPVVEFLPAALAHPLDADLVEARLFATFGRGVATDSLDSISVTTADGDPVPVDFGLHYGNHTHALVGRPQQDWAPDTDYVLQVGPGLTTFDGDVFDGTWSGTFSTRLPEEELPPECGCSAGGGAESALLVLLVPLWIRRRLRRE